MKKTNRIPCIALAISVCITANAQEPVSAPTLGIDIPTSPQAVAFNKLSEYTVDNAYGVLDIEGLKQRISEWTEGI